jgi:hypothetical protein
MDYGVAGPFGFASPGGDVMKKQFLKGSIFGSILVAVIFAATSALTGTGIGGVFNLGRKNSVDKATALTGTTAGSLLKVTNRGAGPALRLSTQAGTPPLQVNSNALIANLNADTLDGIHSTGFVQGTGRVVQSRLTEPVSSGNAVLLTLPGFGTVEASCSNPGFRIFWRNSLSGTALDVWWTFGATTQYLNLAPTLGTYMGPFDTNTDTLLTFVAGSDEHTVTGTATAHWSPGGCVFLSRAVVQ